MVIAGRVYYYAFLLTISLAVSFPISPQSIHAVSFTCLFTLYFISYGPPWIIYSHNSFSLVKCFAWEKWMKKQKSSSEQRIGYGRWALQNSIYFLLKLLWKAGWLVASKLVLCGSYLAALPSKPTQLWKWRINYPVFLVLLPWARSICVLYQFYSFAGCHLLSHVSPDWNISALWRTTDCESDSQLQIFVNLASNTLK